MSVRRERPARPDRARQGATAGPAAGGAAGSSGPWGLSWAAWRQIASYVLLGILALTGLASVAMSSTGLLPAVVMGVLVLSIVVAVGIGRALR